MARGEATRKNETGSQMTEPRLEYRWNRFGDIVVNVASLPREGDPFRRALQLYLPQWEKKGHYGVWLKLPVTLVAHVPICVDLGFKCHHANEKYFMMTKWFPKSSPKFPTFGTHNVGVSVLVIRYLHQQPQLLMVREKYAKKEWNWKCVSGGVELGEFVQDAAVRELREETGLRSEFQTLIGIWNRKNTKFGRGEIHFGCLVRLMPRQDTNMLKLQEDEIVDAKWVDLEEAFKNSVNDPRGIERHWIVSLLSSAMAQAPEPAKGLKTIQTRDFRGAAHRMQFHLTGWNQTLFDQAATPGILKRWNQAPPGLPPPAWPRVQPNRWGPVNTPCKPSPVESTNSVVVQDT